MGIERLSLEARVLYTAFCLFLLVGAGTSAWFVVDDGTTSTAGTLHYYKGEDAPTAAPQLASDNAGGPDVHMPDDVVAPAPTHEAARELRFEKPARQVMETFHFHLFTVPVCLLIVGHIFMMCSFSTRVKAWALAIASSSTLLHILVPPLVRFVSPAWAVAMFPSAVVMGVLWMFLTAWPVFEMWRPRGETRV
jgi:hypothetical protein